MLDSNSLGISPFVLNRNTHRFTRTRDDDGICGQGHHVSNCTFSITDSFDLRLRHSSAIRRLSRFGWVSGWRSAGARSRARSRRCSWSSTWAGGRAGGRRGRRTSTRACSRARTWRGSWSSARASRGTSTRACSRARSRSGCWTCTWAFTRAGGRCCSWVYRWRSRRRIGWRRRRRCSRAGTWGSTRRRRLARCLTWVETSTGRCTGLTTVNTRLITRDCKAVGTECSAHGSMVLNLTGQTVLLIKVITKVSYHNNSGHTAGAISFDIPWSSCNIRVNTAACI
mmetsp:Transcript_16710/g.41757  ORF Transcript_16710/g.41757 Transcript_16710/m.41757 type:complete len:283 (+) Transcript_16710:123-971(+)